MQATLAKRLRWLLLHAFKRLLGFTLLYSECEEWVWDRSFLESSATIDLGMVCQGITVLNQLTIGFEDKESSSSLYDITEGGFVLKFCHQRS